MAIKGQKKKAVIVGVKQKQRALIPKFDSNNIVLIEDNGISKQNLTMARAEYFLFF